MRTTDRRFVAWLMAAVLFVAGVPVTMSAIPGSGEPALTLDICHPMQWFDSVPALIVAPPLRGSEAASPLPIAGNVIEFSEPALIALATPPDPPPPEALA